MRYARRIVAAARGRDMGKLTGETMVDEDEAKN
jgi:hypothetical protein